MLDYCFNKSNWSSAYDKFNARIQLVGAIISPGSNRNDTWGTLARRRGERREKRQWKQQRQNNNLAIGRPYNFQQRIVEMNADKNIIRKTSLIQKFQIKVVGSADRCTENTNAFGEIYRYCRSRNHVARVCRNRNINCLEEYEKVGILVGITWNFWHWKRLFLNNIFSRTKDKLLVKLDTDPHINVIPEYIYTSLGINKELNCSNITVKNYVGHKLKVLGKINIRIRCRNLSNILEFIVIELTKTAVLGIKAIQKLNLVTRNGNIHVLTECFNISKCKHIFERIGNIKVVAIDFKLENNYNTL